MPINIIVVLNNNKYSTLRHVIFLIYINTKFYFSYLVLLRLIYILKIYKYIFKIY